MVETDAIFGEGIEVGCFVVLGSVAGEAFPGDVIGHDEDDVGSVSSYLGVFICRDEHDS